jgi:hypothetical protein
MSLNAAPLEVTDMQTLSTIADESVFDRIVTSVSDPRMYLLM